MITETPPILVCERIIDDILLDDLRSKWAILAEVSKRLQVKVIFERTSTVEGYQCLRFLIRGETLEQATQYAEAVRTLPGLEAWKPLDPEMDTLYAPDSTWWVSLPYGHNLFEELAYPFDGKILEAWDEDARRNSTIPKKLLEYPLIFMAHDWVVPAALPEDWLNLYFKAINYPPDSPEIIKRYVAIFQENSGKWRGGAGIGCRYLPSLLSMEGKVGVRLMLRWDHQELWEFFVAHLRTLGLPMEDWHRISVEEYRQGRDIRTPGNLSEQRKADLLQLVEEARRLNGGG